MTYDDDYRDRQNTDNGVPNVATLFDSDDQLMVLAIIS